VYEVDRLMRAHRTWVTVIAAALPVILAWVLSLGSNVDAAPAALALVLPVVAAAATGIRIAGLAAALTAAASFDFFLTAPVRTFRISDPTDIAVAVLLLVVGFAVSELAIWGRRQQAKASREQGYLDGLLTTAGAVAAGDAGSSDLVDLVRNQLVVLLQLDACRFDPATEYGLPTLGADGTLSRADRIVDVTRLGLPTDTSFTVPVRNRGTVYGHYVLTASTRVLRPNREELRVAVMLADQVGSALTAGPGPAGRHAQPQSRTAPDIPTAHDDPRPTGN
jgi:hypothetical protein